jgi:hypothetical protein
LEKAPGSYLPFRRVPSFLGLFPSKNITGL